MSSLKSPMVISDDELGKQPTEAEEQMEEDQRPDWLPDDWTMTATRLSDDTIQRYYTTPITYFTFSTKAEVIGYISSGAVERASEAEKTCADKSKLQGMYRWLPDGWVVEIRAGGDKMDLMFKFYVHLPSGVRLTHANDVMLFVNEGKINSSIPCGKCDTSSEDNILAHLVFNLKELPAGWVKEVAFKKYSDRRRRHLFYTDPVSHRVFRTLDSARKYFFTGEMTEKASKPTYSVTEIYSFDDCAVMHKSLENRMKIAGRANRKSKTGSEALPNGQTSSHSEESRASVGLDPQSEIKEKKSKTAKTRRKEAVASEASKEPRTRGRPRKILKQTE